MADFTQSHPIAFWSGAIILGALMLTIVLASRLLKKSVVSG
jgi:hypothetical protein